MPASTLNEVMPQHIMIIAGEASGDLHAANLARELKKIAPHISLIGMGGKAMQAAGVELLFESSKIAVVGLFEVFSHLGDILEARRVLISKLKKDRPALLILIDFPDFNLSLAAKAKKIGIPILYYISPQIWAWRTGRVKTIAARVDRMAVIMPFEKKFYADHGLQVDFVGHPLLDAARPALSKASFLKKYGLPENRILVGILPGSRKKEIRTLLPTFLQAAEQILARHPDTYFLIPLAPSLEREDLLQAGVKHSALPLSIIEEDRYDLMASCDLVMAASGTVTLELAILNTPMIVAYRLSAITYLLGRRLIKVHFASLVNLIANRTVVSEILQDDFVAEKITDALLDIWPGTPRYQRMRRDLLEVREKLGAPGASARTAALALEMIGKGGAE